MNSSKAPAAKIRVALIGCGQIADAHLAQLKRLPEAEIVGVCDVHEDLAWQAARRFQVRDYYTNFERMIEATRPDVVHITTPAHTHAPLAKDLLAAGCHVYVEKPFTLDTAEAREVLQAAESAGRFVCVGHDQLFDPAWLLCKRWIQQGRIGQVRHIESVLGYPIDGKFGSLVAAQPQHWVRKLPGGLFQNTISHPLYRVTDLMLDPQPALVGGWSYRPEFDFPTELSLSLQGRTQSGSLTFSTFLPPQRITRVYGATGTIDVDFDAQTLRLTRQPKLPGAFAKLESPLRQLGNSLWNMNHNACRFLRGDIHYFDGMKNLFREFYRSILTGAPLPIPSQEVERVTCLMDRIFAHCRQNSSARSTRETSRQLSAAEEVISCP